MRSPAGSHRDGDSRNAWVTKFGRPALAVAILVAMGTATVLNQRDDSKDSALDIESPVESPDAPVATAPQDVRAAVTLHRAKVPPGEKLRELRRQAGELATDPPPPAQFRVGTFNILGSQHTGPGGDKGKGWRDGAARLPGAVERIKAHGVSVVGLQEAQPDQLAGLTARTGFAAFPGPDASPLDRVNTILYDPAVFKLVSAESFMMTNGNGLRAQPIVLLEHIVTGQRAYFVNCHPPAGFDRATTAKRAAANGIMVRVINELEQQDIPVVLTGDMNDRAAFVQRVINPAGLVASGGTSGQMPVDWVVGTPNVQFTDYIRDTSTVSRRISDHFFVSATVTIGAS
jgi:hypothetical protein